MVRGRDRTLVVACHLGKDQVRHSFHMDVIAWSPAGGELEAVFQAGLAGGGG